MRKFNVEGPCDPQLHFMVRREALIRHGIEKIREGKFFTIFAPRQAGKTTYFLELLREVERNGDLHLVPIWITVEGLGYTGEDLLRYFKIRLHDRTKDPEIQKIIAQHELKQFADFDPLMRAIYQNTQKRIVLVIDEFDDIPDDRISEIMHIFRSLYHERDVHALHSLALVRVRNISGVVLDRASLYKNKSYLIEIKRWTDPAYYEKGKRQLAEYAKSEGLTEGYYVVFSSRHTENDTLYEEDDLNGVKIFTYVIRTNFEQASSV